MNYQITIILIFFLLLIILIFFTCWSYLYTTKDLYLPQLDISGFSQVERKTITIYNKNIAYFEAGQGETLIFIHGSGSSLEIFEPLINELKDDYKCIAIDLPGHGFSEYFRINSLDDYCNLLEDFTQKLAIKKPIWIGHSLGGIIVCHLSHVKPGICKKVINLDGIILIKKPVILQVIRKFRFSRNPFLGFNKLLSKIKNKNLKKKIEDDLRLCKKEALLDNRIALLNYDLSKRVSEIKPSLLTCGTGEIFFTTSDFQLYCYRFRRLFGEVFANSRQLENFRKKFRLFPVENFPLIKLPGLGHYLIAENHVYVSCIIKDFIKNNLQSSYLNNLRKENILI